MPVKIIGKRCFFHQLKPGDYFSNNEQEYYETVMSNEYGLGFFIRGTKPCPTEEEAGADIEAFKVRNAMVYKLTITKKGKKKE